MYMYIIQMAFKIPREQRKRKMEGKKKRMLREIRNIRICHSSVELFMLYIHCMNDPERYIGKKGNPQ